jgi:pimeloyl-ACP methyl ester carboxylesterase
MVLCAPVTKAKIHYWAKTQKFIDEINKKGYLSYEKDERVFEIPKQYLDERASVNQREILTKIKCPTLIIHGSSDDAIPIENSKEAMQYLPPSSKLEILKGGHHTLNKKTDEVISLAVNWFNKYLK